MSTFPQRSIEENRALSLRLKPSRKWQTMKLSPGETTTLGGQFYRNHLYGVGVDRFASGWPLGGGPFVKLGIASLDGEARHDWRDFQRIKNDIVGPEWEAIELYPAESRLMDPSNFYLLWCAPEIKVGSYCGRVVASPLECVAEQRGWHVDDEPPDAKAFNMRKHIDMLRNKLGAL